jgi:DNA helicase-2/ATP-dependent DNA helicase PcrA
VAITRAREQLVMVHDGGSHRPSRFIAETAWEDCRTVSTRLAESQDDAYSSPLVVSSPDLVGRYLSALGSALPITAAAPDRISERVAGDRMAAGNFWPGQRLRHAVFGEGEVGLVEGDPTNPVIEVHFEHAGRRRLIARLAPIELVAGVPT